MGILDTEKRGINRIVAVSVLINLNHIFNLAYKEHMEQNYKVVGKVFEIFLNRKIVFIFLQTAILNIVLIVEIGNYVNKVQDD